MLLHSFLPNKGQSLVILTIPHQVMHHSKNAPIQEIPLADVGHFKGQTTKQTSNSLGERFTGENATKGQMKTGCK